MKILCDRHQLSEALAVAAAIAPVKTPKAIAKHVYLEVEDEGLTLLATDFEMSVRLHIDSVKVVEPGSVLLPAKEAHALVREITDPTVTLESEEFRCTLRSGGGAYVLLGEDPSQFPRRIQIGEGETVRMPADALLRMLRQTTFAAAREDSRYAVNGVLVQWKGGALRMVATDGRRLAMSYRNLDCDTPDCEMIVSLRALQALTRALPEGSDEEVEIVFTPNQAGFELGKPGSAVGMTLVSQVLDSRFPDYEGVIPRAADTSVEISRELLVANLRRVAILSSGDVRCVRFHFGSSSLELMAESSDIGRADVSMDVDVKGPGGSIGFNPDYVLEALKVCEEDVVRLDMTDEETPAKFTLGEAFSYVLMPISSA